MRAEIDKAVQQVTNFVLEGEQFFRGHQFDQKGIVEFQSLCRNYVEALDDLGFSNLKIREDLNNFATASHIHFQNELLQQFVKDNEDLVKPLVKTWLKDVNFHYGIGSN